MIRSFKHKGLRNFYYTGSKSGIQPRHAEKLRRMLTQLNESESPDDVNIASWRAHLLCGDLEGYWSAWVDQSSRLIFKFEGKNVVKVDYLNYH